jgi:hypothetical protein
MNRPIRPKATALNIVPGTADRSLADRPRAIELTPDEEQTFLQELAGYEAAYRQTGDPFPLWKALDHVELYGQTVPYWLTKAFFGVVHLAMTPDDMRRARERWWAARRYQCVHDLRETVDEHTGKKYTKPAAIDRALIKLRAEGDKGVKRRGKPSEEISRDAIEDSYDKVKKDLERRGYESQYCFFVKKDWGTHLLPE